MDWKELDALIDDLDSTVNVDRGLFGLFGALFHSGYDWKAIWSRISDIHRSFREVRYPTREAKQSAWERFKAIESEARDRSKSEQEKRRWSSQGRRNEILDQVGRARPNSLLGFDPVTRDELKALGRILSEAGKALSEHKHEMLGEHKRECFEAIQKMREVHNAWWEEFKQAHEKRYRDAQQKHDAWRTGVRANIERNTQKHRDAAAALERFRDRADDLRSKIDSAWNAAWAAERSQKLSELEERIASTEEHLRRIESWIEEDRRKLDS